MEKQVAALLLKMKADALHTEKTDEAIKELFDRYDMLFLGKDLNTIYTLELLHHLNRNNIEISNDELLKIIPAICKSLSMKCVGMINAENSTMKNPPIVQYSIELF